MQIEEENNKRKYPLTTKKTNLLFLTQTENFYEAILPSINKYIVR